MAINWEMGVSDPLKGVNTGLATLGQALQQQRLQERQDTQDTRANSLHDLQIQQQQLQLQKAQEEAKNRTDLQTLVQSQNGRTTPVTSQVPNPAYNPTPSTMEDPNLNQDQPAQISQIVQQPMDERAKAAETQKFMSDRGMYDELEKRGKVTSLTDKIDENKRQQMGRIQNAGSFAYSQYISSHKGDEEGASQYAAKAAMQAAVAEGIPTDGMEKAQYRGNVSFMPAPDGGFMSTEIDHVKGTLEVKHIAPVKDAEGLLDKRLAATAAEGEKNRAAADERLRKTIASGTGPRGGNMGVNMNGLNPQQKEALSAAIGEGRLDPYKVNSKNQQVLADAAIKTPGIDLNARAAELGMARDKSVIMKAGVAEMIPNLLKKTAEAGKALDYSDVKFVGIAEKWKAGQINDPKITKYMTLRNDQLLTIGGVMRSNGMTDMAQRLEEEAMHPTLAPKALDSWVEGQLESIDPRLNFYRSVTKGNKNIPRSDYVPGSGTAGLYGLKDAAPKTGGNTKSGGRFSIIEVK